MKRVGLSYLAWEGYCIENSHPLWLRARRASRSFKCRLSYARWFAGRL